MTRTINIKSIFSPQNLLQKDLFLLIFPTRVKRDCTQHADVNDENFHPLLFIQPQPHVY